MSTLDLVVRSTERGAVVSVFADQERKTITPQGFARTGVEIGEAGEVISLEVEGSQHVAAYAALITLLRYAAPLKKFFQRTRVFTNSPLLANQVQGVWKVRDPALKTLHSVAVQLKGDIVVKALPPERILRGVAVGEQQE